MIFIIIILKVIYVTKYDWLIVQNILYRKYIKINCVDYKLLNEKWINVKNIVVSKFLTLKKHFTKFLKYINIIRLLLLLVLLTVVMINSEKDTITKKVA